MVAEGLVASLARPGGNITGISILSPELDGKRQGLLMEAVPNARRMAALFDSRVTKPSHIQVLQDAARGRGLELSVFGVARTEDVPHAIGRVLRDAEELGEGAVSVHELGPASHEDGFGDAFDDLAKALFRTPQ